MVDTHKFETIIKNFASKEEQSIRKTRTNGVIMPNIDTDMANVRWKVGYIEWKNSTSQV